MPRRNELCSCGSGKKYKKCCALQQEISQAELVQEEIDRIIQTFLDSPLESYKDLEELEQYEREWSRKLRKLVDEDFLNEVLPNYFLFIARQDLWKRYVVKVVNRITRKGTKEVLTMWQNPLVLFGEIIAVEEESFTIAEILGHRTYIAEKKGMSVEVGGILFGIAFSDTRANEKGVMFINAQVIVKEAKEEVVETVTSMAKESGEQTSYAFFKKYMADVYKVLFEWRPEDEADDLLEELTPRELSVLEDIEDVLLSIDFYEEDIEVAQMIALLYLQNEPNFRKSEVIAAAIVYVIQDYSLFKMSTVDFTQKEVAQLFGVSVSSMMKRVEPIEEILFSVFSDEESSEEDLFVYHVGTDPSLFEEESWQIFCQIEGKDLSNSEIEAIIAHVIEEGFEPENNEQHAQAIAYEGYYAESSEEMLTYVKRVQQLDANNVDAYLLKAKAVDDRQAEALYKKAIQYGGQTFNDYVDDVWMFIPNRPYLRAHFSYGVWLYERGRLQEAIKQLERVLVLDQADHLHTSHLLAALHIQQENYSRAREIIDTYEMYSESLAPYLYLRWLLEVETPDGDINVVDELFEEASLENPYVEMVMMQELPKLPYPLQEEIPIGSIEEALYIWMLIGEA